MVCNFLYCSALWNRVVGVAVDFIVFCQSVIIAVRPDASVCVCVGKGTAFRMRKY